MKNKVYLTTLIVLLIGAISFSFKTKHVSCKSEFMNYPNGASANLGAGYTGASWDNGGLTCGRSGCHGGGSFNPTTTLSLSVAANPVTQYIPGTVFTFSIKIAAASGSPKYGFNAMCATTTAHTNINKWGTMPTGSKNTLTNARNYVEQSSARSATGTSPTSFYTVNIPWTAPPAGTGSVTFYAEGMAVNGTGGTGGDSPAPAVSMTIAEGSVLPVKISSVTAQKNSTGVNITWVTEQEINTKYYAIEHSTDGIHFEQVGNIPSIENNSTTTHTYNYTHAAIISGKHFYRVVEVDQNGIKTYSSIVSVSFNAKNIFSINPNPVTDIINLPSGLFSGSNFVITGADGRAINTGKIQGSQIPVNRLTKGAYILTIFEKTSQTQSCTFIKE